MNPRIERAVLLAAGRGTRLGALTETFPKPLLQVGGEQMLHRILGGLAAGGVHDVAVVTGHIGELVETATGDGGRWGLNVTYFRQQSLDGTARALGLAREFLGMDRFFLGWLFFLFSKANNAQRKNCKQCAENPHGASFGTGKTER